MKSFISLTLQNTITRTLERQQKVLIWHHRKGYAHLRCDTCEEVLRCDRCGVVLKYYQSANQTRCSYCAYRCRGRAGCPSCKQEGQPARPQAEGIGIERMAEEIRTLFPERTVAPVDENTEAEITLSTGRLTKDFDTQNIGLAAVAKADDLLYMSDFRAYEKAYRQLKQWQSLAPKAPFLIQTYAPTLPLFQCFKKSQDQHFLTQELKERQLFRYPPYTRWLSILLTHKEPHTLTQATNHFLYTLQNTGFPQNVIVGPQSSPLKRKQAALCKLSLKLPRQWKKIREQKQLIQKAKYKLQQEKAYAKVSLLFDVDAY